MPTTTFYNLRPEKKERIIEAIKKEFNRTQLINMSVKRIVEDSGIARGSFYQYFVSREDIIEFIISSEYSLEIEKIKAFLEKNNGDVYEASCDYFESTLNDDTFKNLDYYIHIAEYLKEFEIKKFKKANIDEIKKCISFENLNIKTEEEFEAGFMIMILITNAQRLAILNHIVTKEEGIRKYRTQLELFKNGFEKREK